MIYGAVLLCCDGDENCQSAAVAGASVGGRPGDMQVHHIPQGWRVDYYKGKKEPRVLCPIHLAQLQEKTAAKQN